LGKLLPLFKAGMGGKIGTGKQPFSFIDIIDFCRAIEHLIENPQCSGVYNLVSPEPTTNALFTQELAASLHRPALFTVPEFSLKLIYGEGAGLLIQGQGAIPTRLLGEGFQFKYPDLRSSLTHLVQNR